jgi:carbamoyltransferase
MARILGINGFESSVPFKKLHWPGLEEREYRISQGHDAAAVVVVDGEIVAAAAEERFNRKKHSADFPVGAIQYCLDKANLRIEEIDEIAHGFDYTPYQALYSLDPVSTRQYREVFSREQLLEDVQRFFPGYPPERVLQVNHHLAHAASAYFTSGWSECLVVIIDGMGETQSATVYRAHHNQFEKLREIPASDSIGILYSIVTLHLGFDFNSDEYKIMGLAPYGDPSRYRSFFDEAVKLRPGGSIQIPMLKINKAREDRETYAATRGYLSEHLIPPRVPEQEITYDHRDVAAALQECLDKVLLHICSYFGRTTSLRRLAMAGGVALNCTANGKLLQSGIFDEIYVQAAAGDDGSALGAALWCAGRRGEVNNVRMPVPFLGPVASGEGIETAIEEYRDQFKIIQFSTLQETCAEAARLIHEGKVIAWYRGRMEFGPRALGHRSILADPGHPEMRDRINAMVKMREAFRPFAPAVTLEQVQDWFEVPQGFEMPYMIMTADVRPEHRQKLPAVTHVNGSARVQTVSKKDNAEFHLLLQEVGKRLGREMVLNTSFNVKGQPIVNTPQEAIKTFLGTGIEYLFLENALVSRRTPCNVK